MDTYMVQDNKHFAFWSWKHDDTHVKYAVSDKEPFSIAMVLMEFLTMLLGLSCKSTLITSTLPPAIILLIASLAGSTILNITILKSTFVPGKDNIIANVFSWFDWLEEFVLLKDKQVFALKDSISKVLFVIKIQFHIFIMLYLMKTWIEKSPYFQSFFVLTSFSRFLVLK